MLDKFEEFDVTNPFSSQQPFENKKYFARFRIRLIIKEIFDELMFLMIFFLKRT